MEAELREFPLFLFMLKIYVGIMGAYRDSVKKVIFGFSLSFVDYALSYHDNKMIKICIPMFVRSLLKPIWLSIKGEPYTTYKYIL